MSLINNKKSLVAAIATGVVVFVAFGWMTLRTPTKQIDTTPIVKNQYVTAKVDIKKGDTIKEEHIEIKEYPINIDGTYKATGELLGRDAQADIAAGKPILKKFIKEIIVKDGVPKGIEPAQGYRAIPLLVKKSQLPPYISTEAKFDLFTKENSMKIENLKLLNVLNPTKDESNKMLILEVKTSDVSAFIKYQLETKGFIFLQKNPEEYGEYNFVDIQKEKLLAEQNALVKIEPELPPIDKLPLIGVDDETYSSIKEVEVVVGKEKTKVEFPK